MKACPFCCDSNATPCKLGDDVMTLYQVQCEFCGARGPWAKAERDAIRMWNRRDSDEPSRFMGEEG